MNNSNEESQSKYWEAYEQNLLKENLSAPESLRDTRLAQWQLDLRELMEELAHSLRGDYYNAEENKWFENKENRLMNEKGIRELINKVGMGANRNIFLSNFTEEEILNMMRFRMITLTNYLAMHWDEFEIDKTNLTEIKEMFVWTLYPALKRAQAAGERKAIYQTQKVIETNSNIPQGNNKQQGGGFLGRLFRGGK